MADVTGQAAEAAMLSLTHELTLTDAYRLVSQGQKSSVGAGLPALKFSRVWLRPGDSVAAADAAGANDALTKALADAPNAFAAVVFTDAADAATLKRAFADGRHKGLVLPAPTAKGISLAAELNQPVIVALSAESLKLAAENTAIPVVLTGAEASESLLPTLAQTWNTVIDISCVTDPILMVALLQAVSPYRVIWGSAGGGASLQALAKVASVFGLNDEDRRNICGLNAMRLLDVADEPTDRTQALYRHARTIFPGGTQLLSKRPEMAAPEQWPAYFSRAKGCEIWDIDGKHYYDFSCCGIGASVLGYAHPAVSEAVHRRVSLSSWCTLNPPEEVALAEQLMEIHPWAKKVRFARTGGETMMVAVRIARATTGRSKIAICGYHGWHDWYLAANLGESDSLNGHLLPGLDPCGVPRELRGTTLVFRANSREELQAVIDTHGKDLAAIVMEPCRYHAPQPGFLEFVRDQAHANGSLVIFDEITIGWKLWLGGAHLKFGVAPDIAVFGKTLANGHPMGAVLGTSDAMDGAHKSFISSSFWTESIGPVAALATLKAMRANDIPAHLDRIGRRLIDGWLASGKRHGVPVTNDGGYGCLAHFSFQHELANELRTLFVQLMLKRGFLVSVAVHVMFAHDDRVTDLYLDAMDEVFAEIGGILRADRVRESLTGPVAHSGFKRLTN